MDLISYGIAAGIGCSVGLVVDSVKKNIPVGVKAKLVSKSGILKKKIEPKVIKDFSISEFLNFGKFNETVKEFQSILEEEFSDCNLDAFYENIKTLKIDQKDMELYNKLNNLIGKTDAAGYYRARGNKIRTDDDNDFEYIRETLFHELLHMATTRRNFNASFCGFHISTRSASIGTGLNEGYTELLNSCYFSKRRSESYNSLQQMSSMIECIVGGKFMKNAFFSNDLNAVINELAKYSSREKAIEIILKMDNLVGIKFNDLEKKRELEKEIKCDIANIAISMANVKKENGEVNEELYISHLYSKVLEINGFYPMILLDDKKNIVSRRIFFSFEPHSKFIDLSNEQFMTLADEFYQSNGNKPLDHNKPFINKYGFTAEETLNKLRDKKIFWYDRDVEEMESLLFQSTKTSSSELDLMFDTSGTFNENERNKSLNKSFDAAVADSKTNSEPKLKSF